MSADERDTLLWMVEEVHSYQFITSAQVSKRQKAHQRCWRNYMIAALIWTLALCSVYGVWIGMTVFDEACGAQSGVCLTFALLLCTSFVRFSLPLLVVFIFALDCDVIVQQIDLFDRWHVGTVDVAAVCTLLEYNIKARKEMARRWQVVFLTLFIIPLFSMLLMFVATLKDRSIIVNEWFFLLYCVHYTIIALIAFWKAASIRGDSFNIRKGLLSKVARGVIQFSGEPDQVQAYKSYLRECYNGFEVFGVTITYQLLTTVAFAYSGIISLLTENVANL